MSHSRREFLKAGAVLAASAALPQSLLAYPAASEAMAASPLRGPELRELALRAVDVARSAGAAYADVRLTRIRNRRIDPTSPIAEHATFAIGVRALVNGYWGFAASPVWSPDEPVRLGREAVAQARTNALGKTRVVELGRIPVIRDGHWVNTTETDPFAVSLEEMWDILHGSKLFWADRDRFSHGAVASAFRREERAFASTEGSYCTQVFHSVSAEIGIRLAKTPDEWLTSDLLPDAARGWEYIATAPFEDELRRLLEEAEALHALPKKPAEVGRYEIVFDSRAAGLLLNETLGAATELDRVFGFEANADGTSWITDPFAALDALQVAAPAVTVTANRSLPGGLATAKWDDEGVSPEDFTLVKDGVVVDFQTTRESAAWLEDSYAKRGTPVRSRGCAAAASALHAPLCMPPNLRLEPGAERASFQDLLRDLDHGIIAQYLGTDLDFQRLNGLAATNGNSFSFLEVKKGKPVARLDGVGLLFRAPELWKNVVALGGRESVRPSAHARRKGQPAQATPFTVEAPPVRVKQVTLIDITRKA